MRTRFAAPLLALLALGPGTARAQWRPAGVAPPVPPGAPGSVQVQVGQSLANLVVASMQFPFEVEIPTVRPSAAIGANAGRPSELEAYDTIAIVGAVRAIDPRAAANPAAAALPDDIIVRGLNDALHNAGDVARMPASDQRALQAVLARVPAGQQDEVGVRQALRVASRQEVAALFGILQLRWEGEWARIQVKQKPNFVLNAPIAITGLDLAVAVRGRICGKLFKKWECTETLTSPWIPLRGDLRLTPKAEDRRVVADPRFANIDVSLAAEVMGLQMTIRIGVTNIVNRTLGRRAPIPLLDLSSLERELPNTGGKFLRIQTLAIAGSPGLLRLTVNLEVR